MTTPLSADKQAVQDFWNAASCGEALYLHGTEMASYAEEARIRYELEPYIPEFAQFSSTRDKDVLEIGVGLGADHLGFAQAGARLTGVDLTPRAIEHTRRRLEAFGLRSKLQTADAENLPFSDDSFDVVYSWGVLHHSPNTPKAINEVWRVLRPGGSARIMIYHTHSFVGYMLWIRYALLVGRPWLSLTDIYASQLESPGTKAYTVAEARELFKRFSRVDIQTVLTHGDLLLSDAGQRHRGLLLKVVRLLWPRRLIQTLMPRHGLFLLALAVK
jgi:ubiquinone/menaquinone biosynthesis C-methylase UbiE